MALLAAYSFDAGSGSAITDDSGNGKNLTLTANGAWVAGHTSNGVGVSGTGQAGASGSIALPSLSAFTVMGWFKVQTFSGSYASMLMIDDGAGSKRIRMGLGGSDGLHFETMNSVGDLGWIFTNDGMLDQGQPNNWYHFAVTWQSSNLGTRNMEIYFNGSPSYAGAAGLTEVTGSVTSASRLLIGGDQGVGNSTWDDVRVYDQALDQATITTLMGQPVVGASTGPTVVFSDGTEAEGVYMWNGTSLVSTDIILNS